MHRVTSGPDDRDHGGSAGGSLRADAAWALAAALVALAVAVWSLQLWNWTVGTPFGLGGDSTFVAMQLRDIADQGWYWRNPDLGFPFGQNGSMFPELNVLHVLLVKVLGAFAASPYTPGVAYFVLGFPLAAAAMYVLVRSQGMTPWAGFVAGVLFANAPGHQERFGQLWLASYWVVPLGLWVVLEVLRGHPLLSASASGRGVRGRLGGRTWLTVGALTVVGLSGVYYVAFTLVLLMVSAVASRWRHSGLRGWVPGIASSLYLGGVLLIPLLAARLATLGESVTGRVPASRAFSETELFSGKFMDLLLPWPGHLLEPLAYLTFAYNAATRATAETSALGVVALTGWLALLVVCLRSLLIDRQPHIDLRRWSALSIVTAAFYTVGGAASFVALFFTPQVRTWSRISLYIMLFGLLAVGWWLARLESRRGPVIAALVAVAITTVGVLDQANPQRSPDHQANAQRFGVLTGYTRALQSATRPGCPVFQLPVVQFPESAGTEEMNGYDPILSYLASDDLRFSSGAMRGTAAADWQLAVDPTDVDQMARELAAAGFCAVEVDANGYTDDTDPRPGVRSALGDPIASSSDGALTAYALPANSADTRLRTRLLEPVVVALDAYDITPNDEGGDVGQWVGPDVILRLANLGHGSVQITVAMTVATEGPQARVLSLVDESGAEVARAELDPGASTAVSFDLVASPGATRLRLQTSGDAVRLTEPQITASARISGLTATTTTAVRVATLQAQVRAGTVVP